MLPSHFLFLFRAGGTRPEAVFRYEPFALGIHIYIRDPYFAALEHGLASLFPTTVPLTPPTLAMG